MKTWDAIVIGAGIIGLSLARELHKGGFQVLLVERGEPGREASHAAAGMLADAEAAAALRQLAVSSASMYPEFVHELQDESGENADLRDNGTIVLHDASEYLAETNSPLSIAALSDLEPELAPPDRPAIFLKERSVDPRALTAALWKAAKHRQIDVSSGAEVMNILIAENHVSGVQTAKTTYTAPIVVNCAGAWAGTIPPLQFPTRPVKGQMLSMVGRPVLRHVIRAPEVYLVPRTDGRIVIGSTLEDVGFDKRTNADTIQSLHQAAIGLVPALRDARVHESWAGLRPGTPDDLPILGATTIPGYFVATGHFRDGILLAPITANVMAKLIMGQKIDYDLSSFSPSRFQLAATRLA